MSSKAAKFEPNTTEQPNRTKQSDTTTPTQKTTVVAYPLKLKSSG